MSVRGPLRVLGVVTGTVVRGVGTWMLDVLEHIDQDRFSVDVMAVGRGSAVDYAERVRAHGGRLIHCPYSSGLPRPFCYPDFARRFRQVLAQYGPYDVVHDSVSVHGWAITMWVARQSGVPVRLVHVHSMTRTMCANSMPLAQRLKRAVEVATFPRSLVVRGATGVLAVSDAAGANVFGEGILSDSRYVMNPAGIDVSAFDPAAEGGQVRASLNLDPDTRVVGHVGRFAEEKNHELWVRVAARVARERPNVAFVLVGDGPLQGLVEDQVRRAGLKDHFRFAGSRSDVPDLMRGAMDVLLFPSRYEGLPRVVVEAQCAGLPCVISDAITAEVDIVPSLIHRHSLADPPEAWAKTVIGALDGQPPVSPAEAFALVAQSPYNIAVSVRALEEIYETARHVVRRGARAATGTAAGRRDSGRPE